MSPGGVPAPLLPPRLGRGAQGWQLLQEMPRCGVRKMEEGKREGWRVLTLSGSCLFSPHSVLQAPGPSGGLWGALGCRCLHELRLYGRHCALPQPALPATVVQPGEQRT